MKVHAEFHISGIRPRKGMGLCIGRVRYFQWGFLVISAKSGLPRVHIAGICWVVPQVLGDLSL